MSDPAGAIAAGSLAGVALWTTFKLSNKINLMRGHAEEATVPKSISVVSESPQDSATMFSLFIDDLAVGRGLTAAQAHLLVGEILQRVVLPDRPQRRQSDGVRSPSGGSFGSYQ